jgi:nitrate/nitrite-specific signal transduction histidine kinase
MDGAAQASQVSVSLSNVIWTDSGGERIGEVKLIVRDDGVGFATQEKGSAQHLGLAIMLERAAAIGAIFLIESQPGHGSRVTVTWRN